jgi:hypothetical protein
MAVSDSTVPNTLDNIVRQLMADTRAFANDLGGKAVSSGTDTVTLTTETTLTAYADGTALAFIAGGTNTGAATLNVDSVGAKAVVKAGGAPLAAGDITSGMICLVYYDASQGSGSWMLANPSLGSVQPLDADLTTLASAFTTASASGAASLKFAEDTDNGSNAVTLQGAASTADVTITLPATTGTAALTSDFIGQQTIWIPAGAMEPRVTTAPATSAAVEIGTSLIALRTMNFATDADDHAGFAIQMPKGWDEGALIAQFVWSTDGSQTAGADGVAWFIRAGAYASSDVLTGALGTAVGVTQDHSGTANDVMITSETAAITVANASAEEWVYFEVYRDVSDAADDLDIAARLHGVKIHYTVDAGKDD